MKVSLQVDEEDKRQFDLLISEHQIKTKRNYTQASFFGLMIKRWRGLL